ncbi:unnamed protein product [Bursaphelenchus xylophilus]|uniref:(pine wood nematode) hypothetical protein n=1 Tax=Bursaphelenchus xylophilus TaxID=6326 RepID=A0A1I7SVU4_BURXY|nr:unnamed protein product [Bursaphelenchus xylophilus]CAG9098283.1 unnamed protein product [Bursaphelenchus xylophilus]
MPSRSSEDVGVERVETLANILQTPSPMAPKFGRHTTAKDVVQGMDLTNKTYLITGATSGLGQEVAITLAEAGAHVVMAIRDLNKGDLVRSHIYTNTCYRKVDIIRMDLLDLSSVVDAANEFKKNGWDLHGLILNAGAYAPNPGFNELDNLNSALQTNYLSHFFLTLLLKDVLIKSAPSRIVSLTSVMTKYLRMNQKVNATQFLEQLIETGGRGTRKYHQYAKSKLCNIMLMKKMHRDLHCHGVSTYAVDPGSFINTRIAAENYGWLRELVCLMASPFSKEVAEGAATVIFAAIHPAAETMSGKNLVNHKVKESTIHPAANNEVFQDALYSHSCAMIERVLSMRKIKGDDDDIVDFSDSKNGYLQKLIKEN